MHLLARLPLLARLFGHPDPGSVSLERKLDALIQAVDMNTIAAADLRVAVRDGVQKMDALGRDVRDLKDELCRQGGRR